MVTEIAWDQVTLLPPQSRPGAPALQVWAAHVRGTDPPPAAEPLDWLLLGSAGHARRLAHCSETLWSSEGFSVCSKAARARLEDRRLQAALSLQRSLACDMLAAWPVSDRGRRAREEPASDALEPLELEVLHRVLEPVRILPAAQRGQPPDLREAVLRRARLAGFRPSRR